MEAKLYTSGLDAGEDSRFCCPREVGLCIVQVPLAHPQAGTEPDDCGDEDKKRSHQGEA